MRVSASMVALALTALCGCAFQPSGLLTKTGPDGIVATPAPAGIDGATWSQLTGKLASELAHQASFSNDPHLPPDAVCAVDDLTLTVLPGEGYQFEWTYRNPGDFDQNGEVNAADLGPIGRYLGSTPSRADWPQAQVADGDGNREVNLADVGVIASHWKNAVNGYAICPEFGDADSNSQINISDITPMFGFLSSETQARVLRCQAHYAADLSNAPIIFGTLDDWLATVDAGSPGSLGPWCPFGFAMLSDSIDVHASGERRLQLTFKPTSYQLLTGFSLGVAPALDTGVQNEAWDVILDESRIGGLSPVVTLPGF